MVQRRGASCFAPEAFERVRLARHLAMQKLQGHGARQLRILRLEHDTHAAAAQLFEDSIMRDCLTDHWRERGVHCQCNPIPVQCGPSISAGESEVYRFVSSKTLGVGLH